MAEASPAACCAIVPRTDSARSRRSCRRFSAEAALKLCAQSHFVGESHAVAGVHRSCCIGRTQARWEASGGHGLSCDAENRPSRADRELWQPPRVPAGDGRRLVVQRSSVRPGKSGWDSQQRLRLRVYKIGFVSLGSGGGRRPTGVISRNRRLILWTILHSSDD